VLLVILAQQSRCCVQTWKRKALFEETICFSSRCKQDRNNGCVASSLVRKFLYWMHLFL
jgi:hypothetical protein